MHPNDQTSTLSVYLVYLTISGAKYKGVPFMDCKKLVDADNFLANPKSQILI